MSGARGNLPRGVAPSASGLCRLQRLEAYPIAGHSERENGSVGDSADAADDWIAERIAAVDVCVTSDIPLASRCLKKGARVVSPTGKTWTSANIGNALAGREITRHLRELGVNTRGPAPLTQKDRSRFLVALDSAVQAALRESDPRSAESTRPRPRIA